MLLKLETSFVFLILSLLYLCFCPSMNDILFYEFSTMYNASYYKDVMGYDEDKLGMTVTSGQVRIVKDSSNLVGISIGGGAPNCPCLYIIQVFDNSPVAIEGTLQPGDEIIAINGVSFKGASKSEAAQAIQANKEHVIINYNKLHVEPSKTKSLDIILKKLKHRITESISSSTADAFGLSRAILCNDSLVKRLKELERNERTYSEIRERTRSTFKAFYELNKIYKALGDVLTEIGCREGQPEAGEALRKIGECHRLFEKHGMTMLKSVRIVLSDLDTFIHKAIPDTKLTIKKYEDVKFEYLSYCLKVKEMDDEEKDYYSIQEPLYRVETGNYEYRLVLRSRQEARTKFAQLRSDVTAKIELLDLKHVQHLCSRLITLISSQHTYNESCFKLLRECPSFPLDLDLSKCFDFTYVDEQDLTEKPDGSPKGSNDTEAANSKHQQADTSPHGKQDQCGDLLGEFKDTNINNNNNNTDIESSQDDLGDLLMGVESEFASKNPRQDPLILDLLGETK